jgi:hypothetical protein
MQDLSERRSEAGDSRRGVADDDLVATKIPAGQDNSRDAGALPLAPYESRR